MAGSDHPQRLRQRPRRSDRGGGAGLGLVHRSGYRAAADNRVRVRAFARFDAALYRSVTERVALQANF